MNKETIGAKGEKSRDHLIEIAAHLFWEKGYNATGINEIITCADMSKGSFYFYFTSKKDLALAVTEFYTKRLLANVLSTAVDNTWEDFIEKIIADIISRAKCNNSFGCPFAVIGMETAFMDPDIAAKNLQALNTLTDIFGDVLRRSGVSADKATGCAKRLVALYEGYLIFYRMSKDVNILEEMLTELKQNYLR